MDGKASGVTTRPAWKSSRCDNEGKPGHLSGGAHPVNLPNSITMSRIVMIPLLLWILSPHFPWQDPAGTQEILASILFVLASITYGVDAYRARKPAEIPTMGTLPHPLAHKIMVSGPLIALVASSPD